MRALDKQFWLRIAHMVAIHKLGMQLRPDQRSLSLFMYSQSLLLWSLSVVVSLCGLVGAFYQHVGFRVVGLLFKE